MTAVVASSGGLMFGYDNGVTGGVTGMHHFLRRFFPTVRSAALDERLHVRRDSALLLLESIACAKVRMFGPG